MARWIALGFTLLCFASCSFMSTNPLRGIVAPLGVAVGSFVTLFLFLQTRVEGIARSGNDLYLTEIARRAAAQKNQQQAAERLDGPPTDADSKQAP